MAAITWSKSASVRFPPDAVFAWMTDYQEDDHANPAFVQGSGAEQLYTRTPAKRTILSREGNHVKLHDEWGGGKFDMEVDLVPLDRTVNMKGIFGYEAVWKAVPEGDGTKVEANVALRFRGLMLLLAPFIILFGTKRFKRELEQDFAGHMADLDESLRKGD